MIKRIIIVLFFSLSLVHCFSQTEIPAGWFPFLPGKITAENPVCMKKWLDAPAGKHGFVKFEGEKLIFTDKTPIKFWGVNISGNSVFSDKESAEKWSEILANYGVNSVRFHKFTAPGMQDSVSTDLKDEKYDHMDYFSLKLKEKGIYYGWSPIYGHLPKTGDKDDLLAYNEIAAADLNNHLSRSTIGLVNFAEDLQNLHSKLILNLLEHKNPYTRLRYADDPALIFIEIQNEDDIYFATTESMIKKCPTYKKLLNYQFSDWLINKYHDQENLKKNWGTKAFDWGEEVKGVSWDLNKRNITPIVNHGIYNYEFIEAQKESKELPLFLADMAVFLFEKQKEYYVKLKRKIRSTGYEGLILSSNWQAGSGITHYLNLYADYLTGMIDRHNYYGGGTGHTLKPGKFNNDSMLQKPGSGLLSTGMQQVAGRPFSFSEWLSIPPNEWRAEAAPIIAAYGMGLQGWDASFSFNSETPDFTPTIQIPNKIWPGVYNVMTPSNLSLYPALSRMIYRNDIKEGDVISMRYVDLKNLNTGKLGFNEIIEQQGDVKTFRGVVPAEALAAGRVLVTFTDSFKKTYKPDLSAFRDLKKKIIRSNTDQLVWDYSDKGFITINSPGTKGVVGFAKEKEIVLDYVSIKIKNDFAIVLLTSLDKGKSIKESKHLLVTTLARAKNKGMKFNSDKTKLLEVGEAPILLEPVHVELTFEDYKIIETTVLDHAGNRSDRKIKANRRSVLLDGNQYKTIYYEIRIK